ncbi:TetR family transcriptional regulator [Nocardiopsis sp. CNR-923]|uniref:TetR/AcrR family transcriptional regulator n=1 Tax=Nocardiopsis sp. CNR-923 TaxID=1904965 RepID=UPI000959567C|nr:TetR family transcriptional regulator [Nocardiopsis sp. CNR-923]OLT29711.1 TetR family transcriptional regulator [Nocardiopsis sp. CNR-923]
MTETRTSGEQGLRERKKARLRESLVESGLRLFLEQGYHGTTTEEIAASVGVSQRTFFRYFATKEDLILAAVAGIDERFLASLRARPAHEPPLTALREATRDHWSRLDPRSHRSLSGAATVLRDNPEVVDAVMSHCRSHQERIAAVIAEHTGVHRASDPRPDVLTAVFVAVIGTAHEAWGASGSTDTDDLLAAVLDRLDLVPGTVAGDWGARGA